MSSKKKVLIFIVSYNAELFIESVLERIPEEVWNNPYYTTSILIIDDQSSDSTFNRAIDYAKKFPDKHITVLYNPVNQGYGGNQKIGYFYAIKNDFDFVVLLHGDGQYAPECLNEMIMPLVDGHADAVFGSRMINKISALKGGMPLYKWVANQIITKIQNKILGSKLSEFHSGYRAYSVNALREIPFSFNSDYYDFDTNIIIQLINTNKIIKEIPIPTYYGKEICYVNGIKYSFLIILCTIQSKMMNWGIFYAPKFDYDYENEHYACKIGYQSSHQFALDLVKPGMRVLDIGSGPGYFAEHLSRKGTSITSLDKHISPLLKKYSIRTIKADAESYQWKVDDVNANMIILLDIIEHLRKPENLLIGLRIACNQASDNQPTFLITTANVAFFPVRLGLLFGSFHYGKKGILDKDHHRLFTASSLHRMLVQCGYEIISMEGIPAPFPLALGDNLLSRIMLKVNRWGIAISKGIFAYQIGVVARPKPTLDHLLKLSQESGIEKEKERNSFLNRSIA